MEDRASQRAVLGTGAVALAIGAVGGLGWVAGLPDLFMFIRDGASMKPNTALAVAALGLALLLPRLRALLATFVALIAGGALLEFVLERNLGIDGILVRDTFTLTADHPGRTSPSTAFALVLVAASILLGGRHKRVGQWTALAALAVAADALILHAYAYGISGADTGMAAPTGLGVLAAATGAAALSVGPGPLAVFLSARRGGQLTRRIVPAVAGAVLLTGWLTTRQLAATTSQPALWVATQTIITCTILVAAAWWYAGRLNEEDERREEAQQALQAANADLERRIAERTKELAAANREMVAFVDAVSHDIKAPIRAIMSSTSIVVEECGETMDGEHVKMLETAKGRAKGLGTLVDSLLRYTRVAGAVPEREPVDVSALAWSVAGEIENPNGCVVRVAEGMVASADTTLVRLILGNLISNAAKFSPAGGEIEVGRAEAGEESSFYVRDHGIGFPTEESGRSVRAPHAARARGRLRGERHGTRERPPRGGTARRPGLGGKRTGPGRDVLVYPWVALPAVRRRGEASHGSRRQGSGACRRTPC